jgi:tetratricopeptide (TPR) repeat protein
VRTFLVLAAAAAATVIPLPTTAATTDRLVAAVERYADEDRDYWRRVDEYLAARAEGRALSARESRRYSNAYVYYGYALYRRGDANGAARRFRQAIAVDRTNPLAFYCLGLLQRRFDGLRPAIENLRTASGLGGPLKAPARAELEAIVRSLREQAEILTARGSYTGAARCYEFLAENFNGAIKAHALERLKAAEDEVSAEKLLIEARREIARGRQTDGRRLLKQLLTTYAWTRAAETAKKIYRGGDTLDVKVKSDSLAGKYAARERWIDLETANCIVYCKDPEAGKLVAKRVEDTLARVTAQLQYDGLDWHKDKCKVFVFDDAVAWAEFVKESGATTEWAAGFA